MTVEHAEAVWLDERQVISLEELVERSGFSEAELREFVDFGVIVPMDRQAVCWTFCVDCIVAVRTACRLRDDFDLGSHQLALVLALIGRVQDLQAELRKLNAKMPHHHG